MESARIPNTTVEADLRTRLILASGYIQMAHNMLGDGKTGKGTDMESGNDPVEANIVVII